MATWSTDGTHPTSATRIALAAYFQTWLPTIRPLAQAKMLAYLTAAAG